MDKRENDNLHIVLQEERSVAVRAPVSAEALAGKMLTFFI